MPSIRQKFIGFSPQIYASIDLNPRQTFLIFHIFPILMIKEPIHFYTKGFIKKPVRHYYIMTLSHWAFFFFLTQDLLYNTGREEGGHKTQIDTEA